MVEIEVTLHRSVLPEECHGLQHIQRRQGQNTQSPEKAPTRRGGRSTSHYPNSPLLEFKDSAQIVAGGSPEENAITSS
ncbi:Hypothetical protein NTJ_12650 [Nesidiocoris tenuis]|uniref:Uncharacterized protein n=1 Tax=Nesidiocoris tenuis TaxID=355587 RepID=A0ABN7B600_9HEMI|nr:Hypothetical protein NTJ_12650 [Nesidiocoris tenuis]